MKICKVFAGVLAAALLAGTFAGCGAKVGSGSGDVTEVTIWSNYSHSKSVMNRLVQQYNENEGKQKGIKIVYEVKEGDYNNTLKMAIAAGTQPDIGMAYNGANAKDGVIVPLDEFDGGAELLAKYEEKFPTYGLIDGKKYSIPYSAVMRGMIYNKEMFKAAGIVDENGEAKPPETWDEVREYAKRLTNPAKKEYGIVFPIKEGGFWITHDMLSPGFSSIGYCGYDPRTGNFDYTPYKPIFDTIMGIKEDGSYFPGAEGLTNDPARARFSEGGIGMKFAFSWDVGVLNDQFPAQIDWGVAPYPVVDVNNKYKQLQSVNGSFAIFKASTENKDKNKIFEAYKWFHSDDVMTELYNNCMEFPPMEGMVKETKNDNMKKGWTDFAQFIPYSVVQPQAAETDVSGQPTLADLFINNVWTGNMTTDECLKEYTKIMNDGKAKYQQLHPEYDPSYTINKNWDVKR